MIGRCFNFLLTVILLSVAAGNCPADQFASPYARWKNGLPKDPGYFPIAVWLQTPANAEKFQKMGINLFIGLWEGPTAAQLAALKEVKMPVICDQNQVALTDKNRDIIVGWMHGDEPDNAQLLGEEKGYGPPISPKRIVKDYQKIIRTDPTRPVLLNLGQGVAWDGWYGRGVRTQHPEDYPQYLEGCDMVSFDIYPVVHDSEQVTGKLEFVARGVDRLRHWSEGKRVVWNCIECTRISNPKVKPTPDQVRSEVWMSLIHGSQGLIYFVHQFKPKFIEAGIFADEDMTKAVGELNHQIQELAPVLNSPTLSSVKASSSDSKVPVDILVKEFEGSTYVFAAAMRNHPVKVTFHCDQVHEPKVDVMGENRTLKIEQNEFSDEFDGYGVHLYRMK